MNPALIAAIVSACLFAAVFLGIGLRRLVPQNHLGADTKDTVKLAMGLVATMAALLLGLLVSSAKGSYDAERSQVIQMAAKIAFLDRVLSLYGPEAAEARAAFRATIEGVVGQMWPEERKTSPQLAAPNIRAGDAVYVAIQQLAPLNDTQSSLKAEAARQLVELGELRALLQASAVPSISKPMLVVVVCWLVAIFLSFSLLAPPNATANIALLVSTLSVAGAIFLILELDQPFGGLIQISSQPMLNALNHLAK